MDFLLDEKSQSLKEMTIDETRASDRKLWNEGEKQKGSPADVAALIAALPAGKLRLFVQDRVLCDATRSEAEAARTFRAYRQALWSRRLQSITPLANQDRSFNPQHEPDSFSVCMYEPSPAAALWMEPARDNLGQTRDGAWEVLHEEVDAPRRLDCWYYQRRFIDLRNERERHCWPQFSEWFARETGEAGRGPVEKPPASGALRWISSAQIHERLHAIDPSRLRNWGDTGRGDVPLEPGDLLVSMAGFTQVKVARYEGPPDAAARSRYLLRFRPTHTGRNAEEAAALWFRLTTEDFLDQARMELSDRVMKALTQHFPSDVRVPGLPEGITAAEALVAEALTRAALGGEKSEPLHANLRLVEQALAGDDVRWPGKWSCLRRLHRFLDGDEADAPVVLLTDIAEAGADCVKALGRVGVRVDESMRSRIAGHGLAPDLARTVARAAAVVSLTSADTPLRLESEQIGASHAFDIAGPAHVFAFYAVPGGERRFPAAQFLEHFFSETGGIPANVDVPGKNVTALAQWLKRTLADSPPVSAREVVERLAELHSPEEPFERLFPETRRTSPLDRIRPALAALASRLNAPSAAANSVSAPLIRSAQRHRPQLEPLGRFVTCYGELHDRIKQFGSAFDEAFGLVRAGVRSVVPMLLQAETGCGKNLIVEYLQERHLARGMSFMNVGVTVSPELVVSQLFGHAKGAFTGATAPRTGIFGQALSHAQEAGPRGQTRTATAREELVCWPVFVNEVNSYPKEVQTRLLQVLDNGEFTRLGEEHEDPPQRYKGVVVAATNEPLAELVSDGKFRRDLQMRLGVPLVIPPLRKRDWDIELIFDKECEYIATKRAMLRPTATGGARKRLREHAWPGNARELTGLVLWAFLSRPRDTTAAFQIDEAFLEIHFPDIYHGTAHAAQPAERWIKHGVPLELCCLEDVLSHANLSRMQQYAELYLRLDGSVKNSNGLPDWVRNSHRRELIGRFRGLLPLSAAYLDEVSVERRRRRKGNS